MVTRITVNTSREAEVVRSNLLAKGFTYKRGRTFKRGGWSIYENGEEVKIIVFGDGNYAIPTV